MSNKALVVGINDYNRNPLSCCVNDADEVANVLATNEDCTTNFNVVRLTNEAATKDNIVANLTKLFIDNYIDTALFYFAGHGFVNESEGAIVPIDCETENDAIFMSEIMRIISQSRVRNKIVILDSCFSGNFGNVFGQIGSHAVLPEGTVILTSSGKEQTSGEDEIHGVFTTLLIEALNGGAADVLGRVTPGSVYAYIDQALSNWQQRPLFKSYVSRFIVLRKVNPRIEVKIIRNINKYFPKKDYLFQLNPTFEPSNYKDSTQDVIEPNFTHTNTIIFDHLQMYNRQGLLTPIHEKHMYYAAMKSDNCRLTALGQHYWDLAEKNLL